MTSEASQPLSPEAIQAHLDNLTKPPGSLGKLEDMAASLCRIQSSLAPQTRPRHLALFAADHGVVQAGVTAWPSEVTGLMIANILGGGAASSVFARQTETTLRLVDVGSVSPPHEASDSYRDAKIADATANLADGPAMTVEQFEAAFAVGEQEADRAVKDGAQVVLAGEMGIGNTTPAACLGVLLCDVSAELMTGRGASADDETLARKQSVVTQATLRAAKQLTENPTAAMAEVAGFEIVAMAGFYAAAARNGRTILLDGFITTAAALVAERRAPGTARQMLAAHCSAEPGHRRMLEHLGLEPLLDWSLPPPELAAALIASATLGRMLILPAMVLLPPLRGRDSIAKDAGQGAAWPDVLIAAIVSVPGVAWYAWLHPQRLAIAAGALLIVLFGFLWVVRRRLGGMTGDCLGCLCYLGQLAVLLTASARIGGWS